MPTFRRIVETDIWEEISAAKLENLQIGFMFNLLTGPRTSETSVYRLPIGTCAREINADEETTKALFMDFEARDYISYDWQTNEILVKFYFVNHPPAGGITYDMFRRDLQKIRSKKLLRKLVEHSKKFEISSAFYAALADLYPVLETEEKMKLYHIKWGKHKTLQEVREAAAKSRENKS